MAFTDYDSTIRYLHILSGITWIGLLYFFNLVNLPLLKFDLKKPFTVDMTEKATANITLKTLFWFRWGAMFTLIFGLILMHLRALRFGADGAADYGMAFYNAADPTSYAILMGVILGIIMWFNVWFIIWPAQQTILSNNKQIAGGAGEDEKKKLQDENAPLLKNAVRASRTNTWLSVPMLFGMVFGAHGTGGGYTVPLIVLAVVLVVMVVMSGKKKN